MYKKRNNADSFKKKSERIKKYYEELNNDEVKVAKYVREKITDWLYESDKTRFQLQEKIYKKITKSKHEELVERIIDTFESDGYINEERFVETFIRSKHSYNYGLTKIKNELKKKGVIFEKYSHFAEEYDFQEAANEYIERKTEGKEYAQKEYDQILKQLVSRGFSFQEATSAMKQVNLKKVVFDIDDEEKEEVDFSNAIRFIEKQMRKGYGKQKIEQNLKYKGIEYSKEIFDDFDFYQAAYDYKVKKYGAEKETEYSVINKQKQHMLSRGFTFDEISECF